MSSSSEQQKMEAHTPLLELAIQELEGMNDEEFWRYAGQCARIFPESSPHADYIECKLSDRTYLLALSDLAEVLPRPHRLARLPAMPGWLAGVMAWRGETIAVANLDLYLFPLASPQTTDDLLLVVSLPGGTLGLLVPALGPTTSIELEQISTLPASVALLLGEHVGLVEGIYAGFPLFDTAALLTRLVQQIGMATVDG